MPVNLADDASENSGDDHSIITIQKSDYDYDRDYDTATATNYSPSPREGAGRMKDVKDVIDVKVGRCARPPPAARPPPRRAGLPDNFPQL